MVLNSLTYTSKKNGGKLGTDPQGRLTQRGGWCQDGGQAGVMSLIHALLAANTCWQKGVSRLIAEPPESTALGTPDLDLKPLELQQNTFLLFEVAKKLWLFEPVVSGNSHNPLFISVYRDFIHHV